MRSTISSNARRRMSERSRGAVAAQAACASSAAVSAASASSVVASAISHSGSPVAGSSTARRPPPDAGRHSPAINSSLGALLRTSDSFMVYLGELVGLRRAVTPLALAAALLSAQTALAARLLVIDGAGDGHGVGMSQTGAEELALHGYSAAEILTHYYTGTSLGRIAPDRTVSVLLQSGPRSAAFSGANRAGTRPLNVQTTYFLGPAPPAWCRSRPCAAGCSRDCRPRSRSAVRRRSRSRARRRTAPPAAATAGRSWMAASGGTLEVVNVVGIESYLRGVVPSESPPSWPAAELQAQAIAARSFAVASPPQRGFDLSTPTGARSTTAASPSRLRRPTRRSRRRPVRS